MERFGIAQIQAGLLRNVQVQIHKHGADLLIALIQGFYELTLFVFNTWIMIKQAA